MEGFFKKITGTGIPWQFSSQDSVVSLLGSIPGQGTKILQAAQGGQNQKKRANGFPGGASGKEPACQCRRHRRPGFDAWVRKIPWRRVWQPTPVFLPGESQGHRSLVGYSPQGCKESDMTEVTQRTQQRYNIYNSLVLEIVLEITYFEVNSIKTKEIKTQNLSLNYFVLLSIHEIVFIDCICVLGIFSVMFTTTTHLYSIISNFTWVT